MCKQPECVEPPDIDEIVEKAYEGMRLMGQNNVTKEKIRANPQDYVGFYCDDIKENPKPHWNYRILHKKDEWTDRDSYVIARIEYHEGEISGIDHTGPVVLASNSIENLNRIRERLQLAYDRPVLESDDVFDAAEKYLNGKEPTCMHKSCWEKAGLPWPGEEKTDKEWS